MTATRLRSFVSPYTGSVRGLHYGLDLESGAKLAHAAGECSALEPTITDGLEMTASGTGFSWEVATNAAIGEALERTSSSYVPPGERQLASANELGDVAISPESFALYSTKQYEQPDFPYAPFTSDTRVWWTQAWELASGEHRLAPAQISYLTRVRSEQEPLYCHVTSNGTALHFDRDEATARGLMELIERDGVMLTWANRLSLPLLDWSQHSELRELDEKYFKNSGLEYRVIDLSDFCGVPSVLSVTRAHEQDMATFAIAAAAAPTIEQAWMKALSECFQIRQWMARILRTHGLDGAPQRFDQIKTFEDHSIFYLIPEHQHVLDFLDCSNERRDIRDVAALKASDSSALVQEIVGLLADRDMDAFGVDLTAPDLREAGMHVIKAIVPQIQQLDVTYEHRYLGGERLYHAAHRAGLCDRPVRVGELNDWPHPFP